MSTAELNELRMEVKKYIDHADERVIKMVYAMLEADENTERRSSYAANTSYLTPAQQQLLSERMEKYEKGEMRFSSWAAAKKRIMAK